MLIEWQAARKAARAWWPALVGAAATAPLAFMLGQCSGVEIQKDRQAGAALEEAVRVGKANTAAAGERADDRHRITKAQEEQSRAIQSAPDQKPGHGRLRRACEQLRQQGAERLPAECGPAG